MQIHKILKFFKQEEIKLDIGQVVKPNSERSERLIRTKTAVDHVKMEQIKLALKDGGVDSGSLTRTMERIKHIIYG